jgi:amino acid permease
MKTGPEMILHFFEENLLLEMVCVCVRVCVVVVVIVWHFECAVYFTFRQACKHREQAKAQSMASIKRSQ